MAPRPFVRQVLFAAVCCGILIAAAPALTQDASSSDPSPSASSSGPTPADGTTPDLPPGVTLAMLASRTPVRCKFIGMKMVSQTFDAPRIGTAQQTVTSVLNFQASSLAKIPAGTSCSPQVEACRNFISQ